jgi:hypothetical protein
MGTLNVNKLVPTSGNFTLDGACTVGSSTIFNNPVSVAGTLATSGLVTLVAGATVEGRVQCSVSPTQTYHLVNKDYIDSSDWITGSGKVVWFGVYTNTNSTTGNYSTTDTVTIPVGTYKIYTEAIFTINLVSQNTGGNQLFNGQATIQIDWENGAITTTASNSVDTQLFSTGGRCGGNGSTKQSGIVGTLTDSFTIDAVGPRLFTVLCSRTDTGGIAATFTVLAIKVYIVTAE